jgi:hypothetical protein
MTAIATWVGKTNKKCINDYEREMAGTTDTFFWDDTKKGHAVEGGYFCFIDNRPKTLEPIMKIYKIRSITTSENRRKEWSNTGYIANVTYDTSTRNLLTIERKCLKTIIWRTYADAVGYRSHLQSTQPLRKHEMLTV